MHIVVIILALIWTCWPIVIGIIRIIGVLISGAFTVFGKLLLIAVAIAGMATAIMTGPPGWIIGGIVTLVFMASKD